MSKLENLKPQQVKKIFTTCATPAVILVAIGSVVNSFPLAVLGFIIMVASVIFYLVFYRCPYCGKHLGRDGGDFCQYCGSKFDDNTK